MFEASFCNITIPTSRKQTSWLLARLTRATENLNQRLRESNSTSGQNGFEPWISSSSSRLRAVLLARGEFRNEKKMAARNLDSRRSEQQKSLTKSGSELRVALATLKYDWLILERCASPNPDSARPFLSWMYSPRARLTQRGIDRKVSDLSTRLRCSCLPSVNGSFGSKPQPLSGFI